MLLSGNEYALHRNLDPKLAVVINRLWLTIPARGSILDEFESPQTISKRKEMNLIFRDLSNEAEKVQTEFDSRFTSPRLYAGKFLAMDSYA